VKDKTEERLECVLHYAKSRMIRVMIDYSWIVVGVPKFKNRVSGVDFEFAGKF
jgi:hypothetical protein